MLSRATALRSRSGSDACPVENVPPQMQTKVLAAVGVHRRPHVQLQAVLTRWQSRFRGSSRHVAAELDRCSAKCLADLRVRSWVTRLCPPEPQLPDWRLGKRNAKPFSAPLFVRVVMSTSHTPLNNGPLHGSGFSSPAQIPATVHPRCFSLTSEIVSQAETTPLSSSPISILARRLPESGSMFPSAFCLSASFATDVGVLLHLESPPHCVKTIISSGLLCSSASFVH